MFTNSMHKTAFAFLHSMAACHISIPGHPTPQFLAPSLSIDESKRRRSS